MAETQITDHDALFSELAVELDEKTRELEAFKRAVRNALNCLKGDEK